MRQISLIFLLFYIIFGFACSSGKKALKSGNYDQSTIQAIERLRRKPNHKKSRSVLSKSYPLAIRYHSERIINLRNTNDPFKNGKIIDEYERMNYLYEQIMRSPAAMEVFPNPRKYYDEIQAISRVAAEEQYKAGIEALHRGTRESAIDAYHFFIRADQFVPGYKNSRAKIDEALSIATLKVSVRQIPVPTVNFRLSVEFFQDQVEQFLFHYNDNEFVRFYSQNDKWLKNPDQIMILSFDEFSVGNTNNYRNTTELVKDSVVVGKVNDNGQQKEVIGTVKAKFTEYRREIVSNGLFSMKVLDGNTKRLILHEKFPGEFVWVSRWASFNGDERALSEEQLALTRRRPVDPPPPQELFIEFTKPIYDQLTKTIRDYYNTY